jgi:hypothetical protein
VTIAFGTPHQKWFDKAEQRLLEKLSAKFRLPPPSLQGLMHLLAGGLFSAK